jgi:hypothetical protein
MNNGADFSLDFNSDLMVTPSGSIQPAVGWTRVRQRITRRIITNPARRLPDQTFTPADDVFNQDFGIGLGSLVDQALNQNYESEVERKIAQGVLEDEDVNTTIPPSIVFERPNPATLWIVIGVTLLTGQPGTISLKVS